MTNSENVELVSIVIETRSGPKDFLFRRLTHDAFDTIIGSDIGTEDAMPQFKEVSKDELERLMGILQGAVNDIVALVARSNTLMREYILPESTADQQQPIVRGGYIPLNKRPGLASLIHENVDLPRFTARDAYERIKGKYPFKSNRYIDSIRTAMLSDKRFVRNEDGTFSKAA